MISALYASIKPRFALTLVGYRRVTWTVADQAVVSAANFLTGLLVARYAGIGAFGTFSICWLAVLFVQSLQMATVVQPMMCIGPKQERGEEEGYYASAFALQLAFSAIASLGIYLVFLGGNALGLIEQIGSIVVPLVVVLFCSQIYEFLRRHAFSNSQPALAFAMDSLRYGAQVAGLWAFFSFGGYRAVGGIFLIIAASAVLGLVLFRNHIPSPRFRVAELRQTAKRHWQMSKWMTATALMQWTSSSEFFVLVAGVVLGPIAVGALRAAQNLIGVTHIFFQAADNFGPVRAAQIYVREGAAGLSPFIRRLTLTVGGGTFAASVALAVPAQFWLGFLFGEEYVPYAHLVALYAAAHFLMALGLPYRYAFMAQENMRPVFFGYVAVSLFSLIAAYPAIHLFGATGAVVGSVATQIILLVNYFWRYRGVS